MYLFSWKTDEIENMSIDSPDTFEDSNVERKTFIQNPTPEMINVMVMNAIKNIRKSSGDVSEEDFSKYIESKYDEKVPKSCIKKDFSKGVDIGKFQRANGKYFVETKTSSRKKNEITDIDYPDPELKNGSMSERSSSSGKNLRPDQIKNPTTVLINTMVINALRYMKKPNGSLLDDVCKYVEDKYEANVSKDFVHKILTKGVDIGTFEKITSEYYLDKQNSRRKVSVEERFKMAEDNKPENLKKKDQIPIFTREMIIMMIKYSIKNSKKANGTSLKDIRSYIEENYRVDMRFFEFSLDHILNDMVNQEALIKINGRGGEEDSYQINE